MSTAVEQRYKDERYLNANPDWHAADSGWKARNVAQMLVKHQLTPQSVCEIGCGSGGVMAALREYFPATAFYGFDISPNVHGFWQAYAEKNLSFVCGDFFEENRSQYDVILLLDVFEHVPNPWQFLEGLHGQAKWFVFHVPLEFTALAAMREKRLLSSRVNIGHIHYFTPGLALSLLQEADFEVVFYEFTQAYRTAPNRSFRTRLANIPRLLLSLFDKSLSARLFGGDTLLVLAKSANRRYGSAIE